MAHPPFEIVEQKDDGARGILWMPAGYQRDLMPTLRDKSLIHQEGAEMLPGAALEAPVVPGVALSAYARHLADAVAQSHAIPVYAPIGMSMRRQGSDFSKPAYIERDIFFTATPSSVDGLLVVNVEAKEDAITCFTSRISYDLAGLERTLAASPAPGAPILVREPFALTEPKNFYAALGIPMPKDDASYALAAAVPALYAAQDALAAVDPALADLRFMIRSHAVAAVCPFSDDGSLRMTKHVLAESLETKSKKGVHFRFAKLWGIPGDGMTPGYRIDFKLVEAKPVEAKATSRADSSVTNFI